MKAFKAYTDYPIYELGDEDYKRAPIRKVLVVDYDGDKYCTIKVCGITTEVKSGYLYPHATRAHLYGGDGFGVHKKMLLK